MSVLCLVAQSSPTPCDAVDCGPPGSPAHGILQAKTGVGCHPPPGDLPNPGSKPRSQALQADSLPSEPAGKPTSMHCCI